MMLSPVSRQHAALFLTFAQIDYRDRDQILGFAATYGLLGLEWEAQINWAREIYQMAEAITLANRDDRSSEDDKRLLWLINSHLLDVTGRFEFATKMRLTHRPRTLLSAMWMQFSLGLVGGHEYPKCKQCERIFEISVELTGYHSHRLFCSDACKTKNYRLRKRTAKKLWISKTPLRDIAKQTETKMATVRDWVKEWKASGGRR